MIGHNKSGKIIGVKFSQKSSFGPNGELWSKIMQGLRIYVENNYLVKFPKKPLLGQMGNFFKLYSMMGFNK